MFEKILPQDILNMLDNFTKNNSLSFFSRSADVKIYRELIKSEAIQALQAGFLVEKEEHMPKSSSYKWRGGEDDEVRYHHTVAQQLEQTYKDHCHNAAGALCLEMRKMIESFSKCKQKDMQSYHNALINNGDWHVNSTSTPSIYDLYPQSSRTSRFP